MSKTNIMCRVFIYPSIWVRLRLSSTLILCCMSVFSSMINNDKRIRKIERNNIEMKTRHINTYFTRVMSFNTEPLLIVINYKGASQGYRRTRHFSTFSKALLRDIVFLRNVMVIQHNDLNNLKRIGWRRKCQSELGEK